MHLLFFVLQNMNTIDEKTRNKKLFQILAIVKSLLPDQDEEKEKQAVEYIKELPSDAKELGEIGDIIFNDVYIIGDEMYKKTKTGVYRRLKYNVKNNDKIYRLIYKDGDKNKSLSFNLTRYLITINKKDKHEEEEEKLTRSEKKAKVKTGLLGKVEKNKAAELLKQLSDNEAI